MRPDTVASMQGDVVSTAADDGGRYGKSRDRQADDRTH